MKDQNSDVESNKTVTCRYSDLEGLSKKLLTIYYDSFSLQNFIYYNFQFLRQMSLKNNSYNKNYGDLSLTTTITFSIFTPIFQKFAPAHFYDTYF